MSFGERAELDDSRVLYVSLVTYYGKETIRPECVRARLFVALLGQKTLTRENVNHIKELGYEVRVIETKNEGKVL